MVAGNIVAGDVSQDSFGITPPVKHTSITIGTVRTILKLCRGDGLRR